MRLLLLLSAVLSAATLTLGSAPLFSKTAPTDAFTFGVLSVPSCTGGDYVTNYHCWDEALRKDLDNDNIPAAFAHLKLFSSQSADFIQTCHSFTHRIGEHAYDDFKAGKSIQPSVDMQVCDFGFYHGFMTSFLQESHNFKEVGTFCASMQDVEDNGTKGASRDACFHGIGHGSIVGNEKADWKIPLDTIHQTIAVCKASAQTDNDYVKCVAGAYNGMAYGPYKDDVLDPEDPYYICTQLSESDIPRECYANLASVVFNLTPHKTITEAIALASKSTSRENVLLAISTFADMATRNANEGDSIMKTCLQLPEDQKQPCVVGVVSGLVQAELPESKQESAFALCSGTLVPDSDRVSCFKDTLNVLSGFWTEDKLQHSCALAPQGGVPYCTEALQHMKG